LLEAFLVILEPKVADKGRCFRWTQPDLLGKLMLTEIPEVKLIDPSECNDRGTGRSFWHRLDGSAFALSPPDT
jgi:hypothetical protein